MSEKQKKDKLFFNFQLSIINYFVPLHPMKQAMIFAAGLGTRLKPITDTMPKALVPVDGKPLLWHVIEKLKRLGFERIVVNVHHFADQIIDYLKQNDNFGLDILISDEREFLLETGGGIRKALPLFDSQSPILIHNVDILSNADLDELLTREGDASLLVSSRQTKRYLLFDEDLRMTGWTNIETGEVRGPAANSQLSTLNSQLKRLAFSGIHVLKPSLFPLLKAMPERFGIMDFYLKYCDNYVLRGCLQDGLQLIDVGKLDSLEKAEAFVIQPS